MAIDTTATPTQVLKRYQQELWNEGRYERIPEIVANPIRRHYPGKVEALDHTQVLERFQHFSEGFDDMNFYSVFEVAQGPFVTSVWETTATQRDGKRVWTAGTEVFKVTDGLITDVWNGHPGDGNWAWNVLWDKTIADGEASDFTRLQS
jgi:predicted SnoaL-like aldol condensation-catalyzing enzyme